MKKSLFVITLVILSLCVFIGCSYNVDLKLKEIRVTTKPINPQYVGSTFDPTGMVVTGYYDRDNLQMVVSDYTFSPTTKFTTTGTNLITINYQSFTTSFDVEVREKPDYKYVESIEVPEESNFNKVVFNDFDHEKFSTDGIEIKVNYSDKTSTTKTDGFIVYSPSLVGGTIVSKENDGENTFTIFYTEDGITRTTTFTRTLYVYTLDYYYTMAKSSEWFDKLTSGTDLKRSDVTTISFEKSYTPTTTGVDLTKYNTGKVMGYISGTDIYIVGEKILGDEDCSSMFNNFSTLTDIYGLENFDTSNVTAMVTMFYNCSNLTSLDLSNWNTSNVTEMGSMFHSCSSLTSLDLSKFDTSDVTNMSTMFYECSSLTSLNVSSFDTSKVTWMAYMFQGCSNLTSLDLSNFDTSKVTDMSSMFYGCSKLESLDLSNFDTSKVTDMGQMFSNCSSLTSLNLSSFKTSNVEKMSTMFQGCSKLKSLDVSSFDTSKVTWMTNMFQNCSSLTSLDVSSFDTSKVTWMVYMFQGCSNLTSLDLSNFDTSKVTDMGSMFYGCSKLESLDLRNFDITTERGTPTPTKPKTTNMFNNCSKLNLVKVHECNSDWNGLLTGFTSHTDVNPNEYRKTPA